MSEVKTITLHDGRHLELISGNEYVHQNILYNIWLNRLPDKNVPTTLLGWLNSITEEQIVEYKLVISRDDENLGPLVMDYSDGNYNLQEEFSLKESLLSLLKVNGVDTDKEWVLILKK